MINLDNRKIHSRLFDFDNCIMISSGSKFKFKESSVIFSAI